MKKILKIILINVTILLLAAVVLLASYELYLRQKIDNPGTIKTVIEKPIYKSDPDLGWAHQSSITFDYAGGKSFFNEFGQRSNYLHPDLLSPISLPSAILLLGDSFTFGMNVQQDETISAILQKNLDPKKCEVPGGGNIMNAGVVGYSIRQELIYLTREFETLKPDTVILNIFVGNDITEQRRSEVERDKNGFPVRIHDKEVLVTPDGYLGSKNAIPFHSLALADLAQRKKQFLMKMQKYPGYIWPVFLDEENPLTPPDMPELWKEYEADLIRMKNFLKDKKVNFIVVIIPMDVQVSKDYWEKYPDRIFGEKEFTSRVPQQKFQEICKKNEIHCLDLLPIFQKNTEKKLYFPKIDPHFAPPGNQLTAESILKELQPLLLTPDLLSPNSSSPPCPASKPSTIS